MTGIGGESLMNSGQLSELAEVRNSDELVESWLFHGELYCYFWVKAKSQNSSF